MSLWHLKLKIWTQKYLQFLISSKLKQQFWHPQNIFSLQIIKHMNLFDMNSENNRIAEIPFTTYHWDLKLKIWTPNISNFFTSSKPKQQCLHPQNIFSLQIIKHMNQFDINSENNWIAEIQITTYHFDIWIWTCGHENISNFLQVQY